MTLKTYRNRKTGETAEVVMDGPCHGLHKVGRTCVRSTKANGFAVIETTGDRLIATFADQWKARQYNFAIHGDKL
jgi:hypothetical protein